jgi:hypothetical protein
MNLLVLLNTGKGLAICQVINLSKSNMKHEFSYIVIQTVD